MDDLVSLDWSKPAERPSQPPSNASYASLRPTPPPLASGRSTLMSLQASASSTSKPAPTKPAQHSFSNLVNFGSARAAQNMTLAERQAQLEAERKQKEAEQRRQLEAQFGNAQQWDALGSRTFASSLSFQQQAASNAAKAADDDDDIFAAFNKDTKVDKSSHYPPPESSRSTPVQGAKLDLGKAESWNRASGCNSASFQVDDDDDPFGLGQLNPNTAAPSKSSGATDPDDDFLGDLGRPVDEVRSKHQQAAQPEPGKPIEDSDTSSSEDPQPARQQSKPRGRPDASDDAYDKALAQLIDYGFSPEEARRGLMESGSGPNAQAAANWLLDEAHRKTKQRSLGKSSAGSSRDSSRPNQRSSEEPDFAKSAAAVGTSFFKTANTLWKTGQKKVQQAVAEFQQEGDLNQPKWMRDAQAHAQQGSRPTRPDVTDEALALEAGAVRQTSRASSRKPGDAHLAPTAQSRPSTSSSGAHGRNSPAPRWQQQQRPAPQVVPEARSRLSRLATNDDSFSSHVSASRNRRPAAQTRPSKGNDEPDSLFNTKAPKPSKPLPQRPASGSKSPAASKPRATPPPARRVPAIHSSALQASTRHRLEGTGHFKRGDYANAHSSYSLSMSPVPQEHPLMIVLLTNRALTALKTGEPKQAVQDAEQALTLIGPGKGMGETVAVKGEDGQDENRDMKELYGKALSRKAEALEQMERWADAGAVWQFCVEDGVGGAAAIKGRQRCQNAVAPKPPVAARPAAKPRPKPSATASLAPQRSSEAVTRLREANKAAAREDDEKFALGEMVDARVAAWRDGKRDNLRALLGSLDKVLWENSGWKSVGMHELVMANKVKLVYMKAIAKTHPDKNASTEVRLIAGLVFSTLNEGWDKFKAENGL